MTGFEIWLQDKGFRLVEGQTGEFNTYDNCSRAWQNDIGKRCLIGLYAQPTRIGILNPVIRLEGKHFTTLPTPEMYNEILEQIQIA